MDRIIMWQIKGPHVSWYSQRNKFLCFEYNIYYALCINIITGETAYRPVSKGDLYAKL